MMDKPDYSTYTYFDLMEAYQSIDEAAYPERFVQIKKELEVLVARFPSTCVPIETEVVVKKERSVLAWLSQIFKEQEPVKVYGNVEAHVACGPDRDYSSQCPSRNSLCCALARRYTDVPRFQLVEN